MTLLAPWALWFGALGAAIIGLYILKIKRQRQTVPSLEFWMRLSGSTQMRSLFERLKRWLSMLLWLVITALLILALGNPVITLGEVKPESIVVILDNSASMRAIEESDETQTRWHQALDALERLTTSRPVPDQWLLIEAGRDAAVRQGWTHDARILRAKASELTPFNGPGDIRPAVKLAEQLLEGRERPRIVLISDGVSISAQWLDRRASDEMFVHWSVGESTNNLGIVNVGARLHRQDAAHHVYVRVESALDEPAEADLVFELDGTTARVEPMQLEAKGTWERTVTFDAPAGGQLRVHIDRDDNLALDNEAHVVLEPIDPATVWLVSPDEAAFFFEQALLSMEPLISMDESRSMSPADFDGLDDEAREQADVIIFNSCVPAHPPQSGHLVYVNSVPDDAPVRARGVIEQPLLSLLKTDHPVTQFVDLQPVRLMRAQQVDVAVRATILARAASGDPLLFVIDEPDRQSLYLTFDVLESDMPFRNAFPVLLRNAIVFLHEEQSAWLRSQYQIGEMVEPLREIPQGTTPLTAAVAREDGMDEAPIDPKKGTFVLPAPNRPVAMRISIGAEDVYTAVNLASAAETRLTPRPGEPSPERRLALTGRLLGGLPWLMFALAATLLIAFEWMTYHLRWTE